MPEERNATSSSDEEDDFSMPNLRRQIRNGNGKNLHILSHPSDRLDEDEIILRRKLLYKEVKKQQAEEQPDIRENVKLQIPQMPHKPRRIYKPSSKRVGLTKIRMEDCLRCDACSCIYIDPQDYYKHMRNFHQKYNTVIPRIRRRSPIRHSVTCDSDQGDKQYPEPERRLTERPKAQNPLDTSFITDSIIRQSIKSRWSKVVSDRLSAAKRARLSETQWKITESTSSFSDVKIKEEPVDDDVPYYLSQVEVKIKTEPPDNYRSYL